MKILLFLTSHRQLEEYKYFNVFFQKHNKLKEICDIFIYINNSNLSVDVLKYYQQINVKNKNIYITTKNAGGIRHPGQYGWLETLNEGYNMNKFNNYDYVIHMHPDVFITQENNIIKILNKKFR